MMIFSRAGHEGAGHEGDWALHLYAAEAMLPYFRAAAFVRHIPGIYNATWTDMFIETTYMRFGHGPDVAVGVATDYQQMVKWALSFAPSGEISQNVPAMSNATQNTVHTHHKEEAKSRIKADQEDRLSLRKTLDV